MFLSAFGLNRWSLVAIDDPCWSVDKTLWSPISYSVLFYLYKENPRSPKWTCLNSFSIPIEYFIFSNWIVPWISSYFRPNQPCLVSLGIWGQRHSIWTCYSEFNAVKFLAIIPTRKFHTSLHNIAVIICHCYSGSYIGCNWLLFKTVVDNERYHVLLRIAELIFLFSPMCLL